MTFDLRAYFARIGYGGPATAEHATVEALHALHPTAIPFENLDPLLGQPVHVDLPSVASKLVGQRRGGYCFEHNSLFAAALEAIGIPVTPLAARVRWMAPPDRPPGPRSHMLLRIELTDGPWLADVGFGGYLLAAPVRFKRGLEQQSDTGTVRLVGEDPLWVLQARLPDGWSDLYAFTLEPQVPADYVVANWFTSCHPGSLFTSNLLAQRLTGTGRVSLLNKSLTLRCFDGSAESRCVSGAEDLGHVLERDFALALPTNPSRIWERLPAT